MQFLVESVVATSSSPGMETYFNELTLAFPSVGHNALHLDYLPVSSS